MPTLEALRKVRPDLIELPHSTKLHLSFDTVSRQWRDPMETPRTFCGAKVQWFVEKRPGWDGDEVVDGRAICGGCLSTWRKNHPGRTPGR